MSNKIDHSTTAAKGDFPYNHYVDEENKIVNIYWNDNGQLGRYGVPHNVKQFYPGYSYKFVN
jgi:hypothetical protein